MKYFHKLKKYKLRKIAKRNKFVNFKNPEREGVIKYSKKTRRNKGFQGLALESEGEEKKALRNKGFQGLALERGGRMQALAMRLREVGRVALVLALIISLAGSQLIYLRSAYAATYTFTQTSWGEATANGASHPGNGSGWTEYASATGLAVGADLSLSATNSTAIDDGAGLSALSPAYLTAGTVGNQTVISPDGTSVYMTDNNGNWVYEYSRNTSTGVLTAINGGISAGVAPEGIAISPDGLHVYVANYNSGTVTRYSRNTSTGVLASLGTTGAGTNPWGIAISPDGLSVYVTVKTDNVITEFSRNPSTGALTSIGSIATQTGPQGITVSPDGASVYVANYNTSSASNVSQYSRNTTTGVLSALSPAYLGSRQGIYQVVVSPDNASVYVTGSSNGAGGNSISQFSRNTTTGALTALSPAYVAAGASPLGIAISPDGTSVYTANTNSSNTSQFSRNTSTGALTALSPATVAQYSTPRGVVVSPDGASVYVTDGARMYQYSRATRGGAFGFEAGTHSSTAVSGSGASGSIALFSATGGTITTSGSNRIHAFTTSGTFTPNGTANVAALLVGAGGGGAAGYLNVNAGAGGGGGEVNYQSTVAVTAQGYSIVVGAGGTAGQVAGPPYTAPADGNSSSFAGITATGGGAGAAFLNIAGPPYTYSNAGNGGSGGGGGPYGLYGTTGTGAYGYAGGSNSYPGGTEGGQGPGGGGAGAVGGSIAGNAPGAGGNGVQNSISGSAVYYGGGGAGGPNSGGVPGVSGGLGGGGTSYQYDVNGTGTGVGVGGSGTANTGGGGAGGAQNVGGHNGGAGGSGVVIISYAVSTGTFTSAVMDLGGAVSATTLSYTKTTPTNTTVTMDLRAGNTATPDGTWTGWTTGIASGGDVSSFAGKRYFQYRANLATTDAAITPSLDSLTLNYSTYGTSGTLTSSKYDTTAAANQMADVSWSASGTSATETIRFQVRSSPDNSTWSAWCGYEDCSGSTYFDAAESGVAISDAHPLRTGSDDRYFQYQALLASAGGATPTLSSVSIRYAVNAAPDFDASFGGNGLTVSQVSDSADPNWGKVKIDYRVRDSDTLSGTVTQGAVTPTFFYDTGAGFTAITSGYLSASATANKAVEQVNYTTYTAYWDAKSQIPGAYTAALQVRVTVDDNESIDPTATATDSSLVLDTTSPAVTALIDGTGGIVSFSATDNSNILNYAISNSSDMSGATTGSGTTTTFGVSSVWTFVPTTASTTVYTTIRDIYGNTSTTTIVAPSVSATMEIRDASNVETGEYKEFTTWSVYPSISSGATFSKYEVYRSVDGGSYSLLASVTNSSNNYYLDTGLASTSVYSYKMRYVDTDSDTSPYSAAVSEQPNGQGGTDIAPPTLSAVTVSDIKNTSARVTWNTDELANSGVDYGTTNSYGSSVINSAYVTTGHSVYITGLTPNTTYYARATSTDISGNIGSSNNGGAGYSFTTVGGPVISNVTASDIADNSATVFWNTTTASDSYVDYSTSSSLASYTEAGSASLATGTTSPYQHKVTISGLTAATTYYFQVKSTDADTNQSIDTNNGAYYSFKTTYDTKPPVITNIQTPVKAANAAVVTWQTDELATSQVEYGTVQNTASGAYVSMTQANATPSIFHVVTLSSETNKSTSGTNELVKSTTYYFRVKSTDQAGNATTSAESSFTTSEDGAVIVNTGGGGGGGGGPAADTTAPVISMVNATSTTPFSATINFNTSESSISFVNYGESTAYSSNKGDSDWNSSHSVVLNGLRMGTTYHFKVKAIDKSGNVSLSQDETFKTGMLAEDLGNLSVLDPNNSEMIQEKIEDLIESALPSLNPPFIEKPEVALVTEDSATIVWKTNVKAFGSVAYSPAADYEKDKYSAEAGETDPAKKTQHEIVLSNLKANTVYHFRVKSYVFSQAVSKTDDLVFITKAAKIQAQILERKNDSLRVAWTTDEPTSSVVEYKKSGSSAANKKTDETFATYHDVKLEHLAPATSYSLRVYGFTKEGNIIEAKEDLVAFTSKDVTAPAISGFKIDSALVPGRTDRTQTVVAWKTDEPATSVVYYEAGSGSSEQALANKQEDLTTMSDNHVIILTDLKPGAVYRLQIGSADEAGNVTTLPIRTIVTPKERESVVDVIFKNFEDTFKFMQNIR